MYDRAGRDESSAFRRRTQSASVGLYVFVFRCAFQSSPHWSHSTLVVLGCGFCMSRLLAKEMVDGGKRRVVGIGVVVPEHLDPGPLEAGQVEVVASERPGQVLVGSDFLAEVEDE